VVPTRGVDVAVLCEVIRQWRAAGGAARTQCANELEKVVEVFALTVLVELSTGSTTPET
jgi:hypothetical protein